MSDRTCNWDALLPHRLDGLHIELQANQEHEEDETKLRHDRERVDRSEVTERLCLDNVGPDLGRELRDVAQHRRADDDACASMIVSYESD